VTLRVNPAMGKSFLERTGPALVSGPSSCGHCCSQYRPRRCRLDCYFN